MDAVFLNGALTFTNAGEIRFGAAAGTDPATVAAIDELYTRCGIAHTVEADIAHRMWAKLMLNDGINQTCMAYGVRTEAPRNRAPSSVVALSPPCARRLQSPTPRASSSPRQT